MFVFSSFLYQGSSDKNIRAYTWYTASTAFWGIANGLYVFFIPHVQDLYVLYALRVLYSTGIPTCAAFYYFSLFQRNPNGNYKRVGFLLALLSLAQLLVYTFTDSLVVGVVYGDLWFQRHPVYDWFGFVIFNILFMVIAMAAFVNLWKAWHEATDPSKRLEGKLLFLAGIIAWWPPIIMSILLPLIGNVNYYWIASTFSALWVIFTSYMIFRRNLFKVRVILPAILIIILLIILFINIFVPDLGQLFATPVLRP